MRRDRVIPFYSINKAQSFR